MRRHRLRRLLRTLVGLGLLLGSVAYTSGCATETSAREPIQPSYRHVSADAVGEVDPANQGSPDGSR